MPAPSVHWFQGMFLRPHHFQAAERHAQSLSHTSDRWDHPFNWGLRELQLDRGALANNSLEIRSVKARLPDGTLVEAGDGELQPYPLQAVFQGAKVVNVFLRVPALRPEGGNVVGGSGGEVGRFKVGHESVEDENQRGNPQTIDFRRLNVSLLVHERATPEELNGYKYLKIAQVERSGRVNATPQLDTRYIPPLLACDAWPELSHDVLRAVYNRIGKKIDMLSALFRGGRGGHGLAQGESRVVHQLGLLNEAYALLHVLAFVEGLHPLPAYLELCRLAGQLAIVGRERRLTELPPRYEHEDLGKCFHKVKEMIDALLKAIEAPHYELEPFVVVGAQMHASIQPRWVQEQWPMYIGVYSSLEPAACVRLLCRGLDMKVASKDNVARAFARGGDSLAFVPVADPPPILPRGDDLVYFAIDHTPQSEPLWRQVLQTEKLAIQFNPTMRADAAGDEASADGDSVLRMRFGEAVHELEFTLYAVPPDRGPAEAGATAGL